MKAEQSEQSSPGSNVLSPTPGKTIFEPPDIIEGVSEAAEQNKAQTEQELNLNEGDFSLYRKYKEVVAPGQIVVVIGPSSTIFNDATLLLTSRLLEGQGNVYLADPVSRKDNTSYKELRQKLGTVSGIGNVEQHISKIQSLIENGLQATLPSWLGPESSAQKIPLEDSSVDTLIDHNTSTFLAASSGKGIDKQFLKTSYKEYYRVLKEGGQVILQTDDKNLPRGGLFSKTYVEQALKEAGFSVTRQKIADKVLIPIEEELVEKLSNVAESTTLRIIKDRVVSYKNSNFLQFDRQDHRSDDFYIATK